MYLYPKQWQMKYVANILGSGHTVFTYDYLKGILHIQNHNTLKEIVKRLIKSGIFVRQFPGIWTLVNYDAYEFASKIRYPSYISLETVLQKDGVIFQDYSKVITMISDNTLNKKIGDMLYSYRKINPKILFNPLGIVNKKKYMIATKERAICDMLYYNHSYYFDNVNDIDMDMMNQLSIIYPQKTALAIKTIIKDVEYRKP